MTHDLDLDSSAIIRIRRIGGDPLVAKMIASFLDHAPNRIESARRGGLAGDLGMVARAAHSLKSTAANVGASRLQRICTELETAAAGMDEAGVAHLLEQLGPAFERARKGLEATAQGQVPYLRIVAVVEDNPDNRLLARAILEDLYEIVEYENGADALGGFASKIPDLVLLDISLPDIDGVELLAMMRRDERFRSLPVIALTAHAMAGDREKYLAAGFDEYVSKPITQEDDLIEPIERLLTNAGNR